MTRQASSSSAESSHAAAGVVKQIREIPILFSGEMVRALLDGRKTQTRRIVKPQPPSDHPVVQYSGYDNGEVWWNDRDEDADDLSFWPSYENGLICPYGKPGDRLWVRETWKCDTSPHGDQSDWSDSAHYGWLYRADGESHKAWKPSIFMPRSACRLLLEVVSVRVERLQDMPVADARSEGCGTEAVPWRATGRTPHGWTDTYADLWDSINAKRGLGWAVNPWVWVVEFKRVEVGA